MAVKWCPLCERKVEPTKKFNWPLFIILLFLGGLGLLYFIYYLFKPKNVCPICGTKRLMDVNKAANLAALQYEEPDTNKAPDTTE